MIAIISFVVYAEKSKQRRFPGKYMWSISNSNWNGREFCYGTSKSVAEMVQKLETAGQIGDYSYQFDARTMELIFRNAYTERSSKWQLILREESQETKLKLRKIEGAMNEKSPILVLTPFCADVLEAEPILYFEE